MFAQKKKEKTVTQDKPDSKNPYQRKALNAVPGYVFDEPAGNVNSAGESSSAHRKERSG